MDYIDITFENITLIKELWEKNREYHEKNSEYFSNDYQKISFEDRMSKFKDFNEEMYKISLCQENNKVIGYCISTVNNLVGELESIHVEQSKRKLGIGENLVNTHVQWMKQMECEKIGVTVSQENTATIGFYKKLGFYPNTLYMQVKI